MDNCSGHPVVHRLGRRWDQPKVEDPSKPSVRHLSIATTTVVFVQLLLGAAFRHHGFGIIQHILVAIFVTISVLWLLFRVFAEFRNESQLERPTFLVIGLLLLQILLGAGSYIVILNGQGAPQPLSPVVALTTAHVAVGVLLLASSLFLTFSIYRYVATASEASAEEISTVKEAQT